MDDARRFLRFVLPGVFFAVELCLLLLVLRPDLADGLLGTFSTESALGAALASLLATGGLGFVFSVVHHEIHWRLKSKIDHTTNIQRLVRAKVLDIDESAAILTREDSWAITSALWYERRRPGSSVEAANENARLLVDLTHMLGTAQVAAAFAPVAALLLAMIGGRFAPGFWASLRFVSFVASSAALIWVIHSSYDRAARLARRVIDHVLADALHAEAASLGSAVKTHPLLPSNVATDIRA